MSLGGQEREGAAYLPLAAASALTAHLLMKTEASVGASGSVLSSYLGRFFFSIFFFFFFLGGHTHSAQDFVLCIQDHFY